MEFISFLVNGISLGSIYAIIALGYTMVYGIARMLNFAHGDVIMIGGYITFMAMNSMGLPPLVGVLCSVVICTALGITIERVAYKPLRMAPPLAVLITAIGVSYFLQNIALLLWGSSPKSFNSVVNIKPIKLFDGQLIITGETLVTIIVSVIIMVSLTFFVNSTKLGRAMLAVSEDKGAAQLMGINVNATISLTFAIGSALDHIMYSTYPRIRAKQKIEHFMNDNVHIWSTGFIRGNAELDLGLMFRHIHIHALRGRLSLQRMENILGKKLD